jgi:sarcosine oxidase
MAHTSCDVAVLGLGIMGSATLAALAQRGMRVIGVDRFPPGHDRGSSHGATRVIRLGYFEHPSYVPLVAAAYPLWRELEARSGEPLLTVTGILELGSEGSELIAGTLQSARQHGLTHEVLDAAAVMKRFAPFRLPQDFVGVFQPQGGVLRAEAAVTAFQTVARMAGAVLRLPERVRAVAPDGDGVVVRTERGEIRAECAVVAAGPWLPQLLPDLAVPLRVTRQVLAWFAPRRAEARLAAPDFPVFLLQDAGGVFYGFPADTLGIKVAKHHHRDETVDPDRCDRTVSQGDEAVIRAMLETRLPDAGGALCAARTCLYTMAPDGDFILDRLPSCRRIIVASPCSGHGFKFAPVIGEILADLATAGATAHDISRFSLQRFVRR